MLFLFFKQKTAYEMRISDWSSDVCSSDLVALVDEVEDVDHQDPGFRIEIRPDRSRRRRDDAGQRGQGIWAAQLQLYVDKACGRSAERRVGRECVSTCRSRVSLYH